MIIYVDGNSLLDHFVEHEDSVLAGEDRDENRRNVRRWLARYAELHDCDVLLVWDGTRADDYLTPTERQGRVTATNLPYGGSAFAEISGPANRRAVGERVFVVTDDPRLAEALRRGRATVWTADHFVGRARQSMGKTDEAASAEPDAKFAGLSEEEVGFWADFFEQE